MPICGRCVERMFEEAGVWLGRGVPPKDLRARLNERKATLLNAPGLTADLSELAWLDWWVTPEVEPKRYDTRFFVVKLKGNQDPDVCADQVETVESCWISPQHALARHRAKDDFSWHRPPIVRFKEYSCSQPRMTYGLMPITEWFDRLCPKSSWATRFGSCCRATRNIRLLSPCREPLV